MQILVWWKKMLSQSYPILSFTSYKSKAIHGFKGGGLKHQTYDLMKFEGFEKNLEELLAWSWKVLSNVMFCFPFD